MSKICLTTLCLLAYYFQSGFAVAQFLSGPLFSASTSYTIMTSLVTVTKAMPCYSLSGAVTECRRKRGIEEKPITHYQPSNLAAAVNRRPKITPTSVIRVETTSAPRVFRSQQLDSETIISSFDETYYDSYKLFRQIASLGRSGNSITIASTGCAGAVNFSKFLSCIGLTVQSTVISTAWVSTTTTTTSGFSTIIVGGCTPAFFPYVSCPVLSV